MKNKDDAKILVVDDQIHALKGVSRIMRGAGYETFEASNGTDCLKIALEHKPDLILLDVVLPDIDGREVCRRIKSDPKTADIHVVLLSSIHIESDSQAEGLEHGADGYVARPIPNRELLARVQAILRLKYAESRLRESEELFRSMFENHYAVMLLIEPKGGKIVNANHAAEQFYGYTVSQLCSMYIGEINILPPEEVEALRSLAIKNQQNHFVFPHRLASGEIRTVEVYAAPIKQNRKTVLFSIIHDITDKKMAEEDLKNSEERYRTIADFNYDWEYWVDAEGNFLYCSPSCERITGHAAQEFVDDPDLMNRIIHPDDRDEVLEHFHKGRKVTLHEVETKDFRIIRCDGEIRWIGHVCRSVYDPDGQLRGRRGSNRDINKRKQMEEAVKQSEDKYRRLVETTTDWVWSADTEGHHTYGNPAIEKLLGYKVKEIVGSSAFQFMHPDDEKPVKEIVHRCIEQRQGWNNLEIRWLHKDGSTRLFESSATPILDRNDTVIGFSGVDRDITERKRAEDELERARNQAQMYLDIAGVMLVALNAQGNITMMNRRGREILGYREDEIIGKNWFDFCLPTELRREVKSVFEKLMAGGIASVEYYENPVFTKDGEQRILEFHNTVVHDELGRIVGIFSSGKDVTERKKAEEDLKSSETRYRQLADVTFEGIIFHDEGVLLQANDQFFRMFRYEPDELVGNQIMEKTLTPDSREIVKAKIAERSTESYVATGLRKDGATLPIEVRARMREVGGKMVRATAIRDLSMLKNLEAQLLQAQKMEAIGTLAGGVAHDFNNLLQTVLGYSEFMLQRKKEGEPDYADLQKIYQAGKRGADLVKNLLTFSRRVDTHYLPIDLNQEITAVRGLLSRTIPKTININLHLGGNVEYIKADPSQIGQVLMNLAVNARDAMPDGGTLTIETTEIQLDEKYCNTYPEAKPGSYVLLTISDTGQGMDNETLSHIFEPFFSTKEVGKGTGLGLATVYGIVKQHQGRIICYSELGHGTTFKIYLPAIQTKKELETTTLEKAIAGGAETVLLVDDDADIRDLVATFLIEFGYSVITAVNGKEAVEIYQREGASISVIILDLIMPVMDGRQSLAQILRIDPKARVVIASGYSEGGTANGVMESGAKGFVQKPYNLLSAPFNGSER